MRGLSLLFPALLVSGCSLLVQFDPETQPCDSANFCRANYTCVLNADGDGGLCKYDDGGTTIVDAGGCMPRAARETTCGDGLDDDCDSQVDCLDTDCANLGCSDRDACTTGETCQGGTCRGGTAVVCNTPPNACRSRTGNCEPATGNCLYAPVADGASCGTAASDRCCNGACRDLTTDTTDCGGCGLACGSGQVCQPINQSACGAEPIDTSGRCSCSASAPCPNGQVCTSGYCRPAAADDCAPGQQVGDGGFGCQTYCRY
ncbi:MAG TPA: hypothetical protein VGD87_14120 [Archangium sp.]